MGSTGFASINLKGSASKYNAATGYLTIKTGDTTMFSTLSTNADSAVATISGYNATTKTGTLTLTSVAGLYSIKGTDGWTIDGSSITGKITVKAGNNSTITTGSGDDSIVIAGSSITATTGDGEDSINGTGNNVTVSSGAGNDKISLTGSAIHALAGDGDDTVSIKGSDAYVDGGAGNDSISISGSDATVYGGRGNDSVSVSGSEAYVEGGDGDNFVSIKGDSATVSAGRGEDSISITGNYANVDGGAGADSIKVFGANATVSGGAGDDEISVTGNYSSVDAGAGNDSVSVTGNYVTVSGGAGADSILAEGTDNYIDAGAGSDYVKLGDKTSYATVLAGAGDDTVISSGRYSTINAGDGRDVIEITGSDDTVDAGAGNDSVKVGADAKNASITLGDGRDTVVVGATGVTLADYAIGTDVVVLGSTKTALDPKNVKFTSEGKASVDGADVTITSTSGYYAMQLFSADGSAHMNYAWAGESGSTMDASKATGAFYIVGTTNDTEGDLITGSKYGDTVIAGTNDSVVGGKGDDSISVAGTGVVYGLAQQSGKDVVEGLTKDSIGYDDDDFTLYITSADKLGASIKSDALTVTLKGAQASLGKVVDSNTAKLRINNSGTLYNTQIFTNKTTLDDETTLVYGTKDATTNTLVLGDDDYTIDLGNKNRFSDTRSYYNVSVVDATSSNGSNVLIGAAGSTTLEAGTGATSLWGGSSKADSLVGAAGGQDTFYYGNGDGKDTISGYSYADDDTITFLTSDFSKFKRDSNGLTVTMGTGTSQKLTITDTDVNTKFRWNVAGSDTTYVTKFGSSSGSTAMTYEDDVDFYVGGSKHDTIAVTGSDDATIWLDGSQGKGYANVTVLDASATTGDVILAGTSANETIKASKGNSSIGGGAGNDLLVGNSAGTTSFYFGKNGGKDTITGSNAEDRVMLYDVSLSDLDAANSKLDSDVKIALTDGSSLTVKSVANGTTFVLSDGSAWTYDTSEKAFTQA